MDKVIGRIFNIQRFSVHDGPGIRTTVFMKGCNLRCAWCHNPESYKGELQIRYQPEQCVECHICSQICSKGVYIMGKCRHNQEACTSCGRCVQECLYGALQMWGEDKTVDEVMETVRKDKDYFYNSNGGMTVSGGEPLLQSEFVRELLKRAKEDNIHTALDTAANIPYEAFEKVLPFTDLILLDLKIMDDDMHKRYTGVSNKRILENAKCLLESSIKIQVRVPLIKGINDSQENAAMLCEFVKGYSNVEEISLLPYHSMGIAKAESAGVDMALFEPPTERQMEEIRQILNSSRKQRSGLQISD